MKAKNCKRCKGGGWLKWYRKRDGSPSYAADVLVYYKVGKRVMQWMPVCPCTLQGVKFIKPNTESLGGLFPKYDEVLPDGEQREIEYKIFQQQRRPIGEIALKFGFTLDQMKIRLCWYATHTNLPLHGTDIVNYSHFTNKPAPLYHFRD